MVKLKHTDRGKKFSLLWKEFTGKIYIKIENKTNGLLNNRV